VYVLAFVDLLSFSLQHYFVDCFNRITKELREAETVIETKLVLLSAKLKEPQKLISTFLDKKREFRPEPEPSHAKLAGESLSDQHSNEVSARTGEGKTFDIKKSCEERQRHRVHLPIHTSNRANLIKCLSEHLDEHDRETKGASNSASNRALHIDISSTCTEELNGPLFELVFFGLMADTASGTQFSWLGKYHECNRARGRTVALLLELPDGMATPWTQVTDFLKETKCEVNAGSFNASKKLHDSAQYGGALVHRRDGGAVQYESIMVETTASHMLQTSSGKPASAYERVQYVCHALKYLKGHPGHFPHNFSFIDREKRTDGDGVILINKRSMPELHGSDCFGVLDRWGEKVDEGLPKMCSVKARWAFINTMFWQLQSLNDKTSSIHSFCARETVGQIEDDDAEEPDCVTGEEFKAMLVERLVITAKSLVVNELIRVESNDIECLKKKRREMQETNRQEASKGRWVNSWNDTDNLHQYLLFQPDFEQDKDVLATKLQIKLVSGAIIRVPFQSGKGSGKFVMDALTTVEDLKRAIHERGLTKEGNMAGSDWPVKTQSLKYDGHELKDNKNTLASYGVTIPPSGKFNLFKQVIDTLPDNAKAAGAKTNNVDLAFTLLWDTADDLDIHVETPGGFEISWKSRQSPCGGKLDVDMNANPRDRFVVRKADNNKKRGFRNGEEIDDLKCAVENVYWAKGTAPSGRYRCSIQNGKYEKEEIGGTPKGRPIPFKMQIKIDNELIDLTPGKTPEGLNFKFLKSPAGKSILKVEDFLDPQTGRKIRRQQPEWAVKDQHPFTSDASFEDALVFEFEYKVQQHYKVVSNAQVDVWSSPRILADRKATSPAVRLKQLQTGKIFKVVNRERIATRQFPPMKYSPKQIEKAFDYDQRVDKVYSLGDEVLVRDPPATRTWRKGTIRKIGKAATFKNKTGVDTVLMTKEGFIVRTHAPYHDNSDAKVSRL
jgi:hypothetical protein